MSDAGPFANLSPDVLRAMASYAGADSLCRQSITVTAADLSSYSFDEFPNDIDGAIAWFEDARSETPPEYRAALRVELEFDGGAYDQGASASLKITYQRPETDAEMQERFDRYLQYVKQSAARERAEYLRLSRKYSGL